MEEAIGNPCIAFTSTEINKFLEGDFLRASLGSKYPIVELKIAGAIGGFLKSSYTYQKAHLSVSDNISIAPFGNLYYKVFAGRVLGKVPYPLLEVHPGNDFHYYNQLIDN